ncbi:DNA phosphorothioation-dependent restriction protein DptF [Paenibacillus hexagrammi]|uniref:DNA phosphorothioation-dependent restriction protein DptF n=1 Tax=Paenibacillus hexagrammi TaxID=2908839 RepID=UPI0021A8CFB5|nr:DNA phosphorothioation-dependent restriction protein DptF [Paenibacillus sp. YPD9-1]
MFKWKGSPRKDYIYLSDEHTKFRLAQKLDLKPELKHIQDEKQNGTKLENFSDKLIVAYKLADSNSTANLEIDYSLFELLTRIKNGYVPNKEDQEDALKFLDFVEKLMGSGMKNKELLIHLESENKLFSLSKDDFHGYVFEKERTI